MEMIYITEAKMFGVTYRNIVAEKIYAVTPDISLVQLKINNQLIHRLYCNPLNLLTDISSKEIKKFGLDPNNVYAEIFINSDILRTSIWYYSFNHYKAFSIKDMDKQYHPELLRKILNVVSKSSNEIKDRYNNYSISEIECLRKGLMPSFTKEFAQSIPLKELTDCLETVHLTMIKHNNNRKDFYSKIDIILKLISLTRPKMAINFSLKKDD